MANKEKLTPADYDRWGRTCVKFYEDTQQKAAQLNGQQITSKPEAATESDYISTTERPEPYIYGVYNKSHTNKQLK